MRVRNPATLDSLYLSREPVPEPRRGEVLVRVRAGSLNYHDYAVAIGRLPVSDGRIPLSDGAGEVIAVAECQAFKIGDRVLSTFFSTWQSGSLQDRKFETVPGDGMDGFARQYAWVPESSLTRMPAGYGFEEAASLACAAVTAWRALMVDGELKGGDTVLIQGSGGVSIFALQLAKMAGARVIATSSSDEKLDRLKALGADVLINYRSTPDWGAAAAEFTDRGGVDHVMEIGGVGTLPQSIAAVRNGGHIALIGTITGREGPIPTALLMRKQIRLIGLTVGSRAHQLDLIRAIEANGLRPVIDRSFPLEGLADAFRYQESGRHFGKICISL